MERRSKLFILLMAAALVGCVCWFMFPTKPSEETRSQEALLEEKLAAKFATLPSSASSTVTAQFLEENEAQLAELERLRDDAPAGTGAATRRSAAAILDENKQVRNRLANGENMSLPPEANIQNEEKFKIP